MLNTMKKLFLSLFAVFAVSFSFAVTETLNVNSDYGGRNPESVVTNYGTTLHCYITNSPVLNGTTQYVAYGATCDSNVVTITSTTNVWLTLTNNATLNWRWQTNYWLNPIVNTSSGTVSVIPSWKLHGMTIPVIATSLSISNKFYSWTGDTNNCISTSNVIYVYMDQARNITANFVPQSWQPVAYVSDITNYVCAGTSDIPIGTNSVTVVSSNLSFVTSFLITTIKKPTGTNANFFSTVRLDSITPTGFIVDLSGTVNCSGYKLNWIAVKNIQ